MAANYASMDFDLWADIDGTIVELVQFSCSYELNRIPSCTAMLPVGYTALPPGIPATTHAALSGESVQLPLKVYATVTFYSGNQTAIIPAGTYMLFCGWVTGVGYRRTYQGYTMTIEGTHWLSALSFSSILCEGAHPQNPSHMTFNARVNIGAGAHFVGRTAAQEFITATTIADDLWGEALLPWFQQLASTNRFDALEFAALGANIDNDGEAGECMTALNSFTGDALKFDTAGIDADFAALAIADDVAVTTLNPSGIGSAVTAMANTTFWDKIIGELAPRYYFALVPYPTEAKIVPFTPGLRDFWDPYGLGYTILARDCEVQDMNAYLPRPLRAVGLLGGIGWTANANLGMGDAENDTIGGVYVGRADGMVMIGNAPKWLSEYVITSPYSNDSSGVDGTRTRGSANQFPGEGAAPTLRDPLLTRGEAKGILADLAHTLYVNELLKNRWGDITGPVRYDIAPGSTIKIEGTAGAFLAAGEARYASVIRTNHYFDAQHQRCYTAFRLAHIRSEDEHNSDDYTVAEHPLYTNTWVGDYFTKNTSAPGGVCPDFDA